MVLLFLDRAIEVTMPLGMERILLLGMFRKSRCRGHLSIETKCLDDLIEEAFDDG